MIVRMAYYRGVFKVILQAGPLASLCGQLTAVIVW